MHTSDLFHKQPWSDGLVNIYDQLGVDYYENKYRWVLGGDGGGDGGDGDDQVAALYDADLPDLSPEAAKAGGYQTAEQAHGFFGNLLGSTGTDQEYADLRASTAALERGESTFVNSRGEIQDVRDGLYAPPDNLSKSIAEFNKNPTAAINPVSLLTLPLKTNPATLVGGAVGSMIARSQGVPDLVKVSAKGGLEFPVADRLGRALKEQVTGDDGYNLPEGTTIMPIDYADGGPVVPQGGIGNFYGR